MQVQSFDHLSIDPDRPLRGVLGFVERRQYPARPRDVGGVGGKGDIARIDLARVDERLAIEAEVDRLARFCGESRFVLDIVIHAVEDRDAVGTRGSDGQSERTNEREPQPAQA